MVQEGSGGVVEIVATERFSQTGWKNGGVRHGPVVATWVESVGLQERERESQDSAALLLWRGSQRHTDPGPQQESTPSTYLIEKRNGREGPVSPAKCIGIAMGLFSIESFIYVSLLLCVL